MKLSHWLIFMCLMCITVSTSAQKRNKVYEDYIHKYRGIAVDEMKHYRIPASITLAQGLLESGAGKSELARKSNNHFGIKCGGSWDGRSVRHDDDARNECFRAYKHPKDSYRDHSKFLRSGARYAFLFRLKITDYKGWARGLKKAGYATDPQYANRLINIIELYDLDKYDHKGGLDGRKSSRILISLIWQTNFFMSWHVVEIHSSHWEKSLISVTVSCVNIMNCLRTMYSAVVRSYIWKKSVVVLLKIILHMLFVAVIRCIAFHRSLVYDWSVCIR